MHSPIRALKQLGPPALPSEFSVRTPSLDLSNIDRPLIYAVRMPASVPSDAQSGYVFVGVKCPKCTVAYLVALPSSAGNSDVMPAAIHWTEARMGNCGEHPPVIHED